MAEKIGLQAVLELASFSSAVASYNSAISGMSSNTASTASSINSSFAGLGSVILDIGAKAAQVAVGGIALLGSAFVAVGVSGTKAFIDLEQGLANIEAISGDAKETLAPLKGLISELALDPNLKVTTEQATNALYALTKQGLEVDEIMAGAGRSTIELANATGGEFKQSAEIAAQAMRTWGLEAANMGQIADGITGVLTNSKFEVNDYALALAQGGSVAANFGVSLTDFNTVIAGSASAFSSGSDAGTSFKNMMLRLAAPTNEIKAAMQQYGISLFDSSGKMRDMKDVVADLNAALYGTVTVTNTAGGATKEQAKAAEKASESIGDLTRDIGLQEDKLKLLTDVYQESLKFYDAGEPRMRRQALAIENLTNNIQDQKEKLGGYQSALSAVDGLQERQITTTKQLTEAERAKLAETLGGADAARLLLEIGKLTGTQFDELSGKVNANGQAMSAAAIRMDTTGGALEILQGVLEAIQLQIGEKFTPMVKAAAQAMTLWASENSGPVIAFFGQIATGIGDMTTQIMSLVSTFQTGGAAGLVGALGITPDAIDLIEKFRGMITQIADTIAGPFMTAFSDLSAGGILDSINQGITFLNDHFAELQGALTGIGAVIAGGVFAALLAGLLTLLTPINLIIAGAALLGAAWAGNWGGIQEKTGAVVAYVTEQITALATVLTPAFNSIWDSITKVSAAFGAAGVDSSTLMTTLGAMGAFLVEVIIPAFVQFVGILAGTLAQAIAGITDGMIAGHNAFVVISDYITSTVVPAFLSINDGISPVVELLASLGEVINAVINKALQAMAGLWQNVLWPALQKVGQVLKDTLMPAFTSIGSTVKSDVSPALKDLGDTIFPLLQEGLDFVTQSIKDLIGYFNSLKDTVNSFSLPDVLTPGSPPPFANALTDIATSAGAAASAIAGMQRNLITSKSASLDFIDDLDMGGLARGFGTGGGQWRNFRNILKNEIMGGMGALADGTADVMDSVYKVAARFNFPPQMAAEFAKANGLVEHLTGNFEKFRQEMNIQNLGNLLGMGGSFSGIAGTLADMLQEQMGSAENATKALDALKDSGTKLDKSNLSLTDTLEDQQSKLTILQAELTELTGQEELDTIAIDKKKLAIEQLTEAMEENRQKIVDNRQALIANQRALLDMQMDLATGNQGDQIAFLQDFLDSGADSIRLIGEELGGVFAGTGLTSDVYWTRVAAQEELTRLLEEQRRQEELITQQKEAQGKLDKLKVQLDLINLGRQLGGDIFAGIHFGLDASIEDLLAATNAVTMAMVDQINHDLQIHSPSGVMIKTFEQVMAGAALGVRRGESMLSDAVRSIPILNGSMPQFSQAAGISNSSTYNYNFPMTVNTAATAQGVVRQYDVRRSLANV